MTPEEQVTVTEKFVLRMTDEPDGINERETFSVKNMVTGATRVIATATRPKPVRVPCWPRGEFVADGKVLKWWPLPVQPEDV